jgi:hypothetical protein
MSPYFNPLCIRLGHDSVSASAPLSDIIFVLFAGYGFVLHYFNQNFRYQRRRLVRFAPTVVLILP